MVITGTYDYLRLAHARERLVEQTQQDERIFAETWPSRSAGTSGGGARPPN
jgi:hypothetical protein